MNRVQHKLARLVLLVVVVTDCAIGCCCAESQTASVDLHSCQFSNQVFDNDARAMREKVPTRFNLMSSRYVDLLQSARGVSCTGTATVAFNGRNFLQAGMADDPGISILIPHLASWTRMSLANTFDLTIFTVIALGVLTGYAGVARLYPYYPFRWAVAALFFSIGLVEAKVADVYIFQASPLVAGIPWILYFGLTQRILAFNLCGMLLAFCCSWCSMIRTGTAVICLAFLVPLFGLRYRARGVFLPIFLIFVACVPSLLCERYLTARRDSILALYGESATTVNSHVIWHAIYLGLSFVSNSYVPEFNDSVAAAKVRSINPDVEYASREYELILRREVLSLAKHKPIILIENTLAKIAIVAFLASIFLYPVRRSAFAAKKLLWVDCAFVSAISISALSAVLVIPKPPYLLTFFCLTSMYSLVLFGRVISREKGFANGSRETPFESIARGTTASSEE